MATTKQKLSMRILIIVDCYLPSKNSAAKLIHDLAVELCNQGHDPIIVTPEPALDQPRQISIENGITVVRVRTGRIKHVSKPVRAINETRLPSVLWKSCREFFRKNPCDLIVFYSPSIFFAPLVKKLKRLWKCKAYMILRDIFPQWAVDAGVLRKGMAYRFFKMIEKRQYDVANVIGVQSHANLQYFDNLSNGNKYRLEVLYNWATLEEKPVTFQDHRKRLNLQEKVVFFYGGNIGVAQDMDAIIRLSERLHNHPRIHFLLVGQGPEVPKLEAAIKKKNLVNISIHPAVKQEEYLAMLSEFDVGLITLDGNLKTHNFPGKMLAYMSFAKPMLASINPGNDLIDVLEKSNAALSCLAGQDDILCEYALRLSQDAALRTKIGLNGKNLLENVFSVKTAASQIVASVN